MGSHDEQTVDRWRGRGRRVTRPRGSLRDLESRGLDSTLRH